MSLTSRITGGTGSGVNHSVVNPVPKLSGNLPPPTQDPAPVANHSSSTRCSSGALMSLLNSGLSVPRQMMVQARGAQDNQHIPIHLSFVGTIGQGTFGQIERATLTVPATSAPSTPGKKNNDAAAVPDGGQSLQVAVKRVLQDPRYKNRELSIMQRLNNHPNVVKFYYYYYSTASSNSRGHRSGGGRTGSSTSSVDVFLHLVLECFPESLCELIYRYSQRNLKIPPCTVKIFTYQMLKALAYLHSHQICHRDIKSSNLLVNEDTMVLKVCDFGSAKEMVPGTANVSYISSRYYRAPELLFGAQYYSCAIDTWSGGCVLAEMLRQHCLFMGADSVDQLVKVIRVLGTPTPQDIASMNPMYGSYSFPDVQSCPVKLFFPQHTPSDLLALMSKMLVYNPSLRILPSQALSEQCFDELRSVGPHGVLSNRVRMPPHIFDPDPEPNPPTPAADTTNVSAYNNWLPDHHRHGSSNKKSATNAADLSGSDKKNNKPSSNSREIPADWQRKGRLVGCDSSEKCGSTTGGGGGIASDSHPNLESKSEELTGNTNCQNNDCSTKQQHNRINNNLKGPIDTKVETTTVDITANQLENSDIISSDNQNNTHTTTIADTTTSTNNVQLKSFVPTSSERVNLNEIH
ncbi:hypothetical protein MN116_008529 [Schistosoma mekongi]|uniref:Protein kinase domain-containing protein n=1 Tax=Schistosoma mekongi TaxID=38744 RepID=A0AAE2D1Q2_SCHME|nr:hypothetical protein MN116_008529 [Schistosoma mekongi]